MRPRVPDLPSHIQLSLKGHGHMDNKDQAPKKPLKELMPKVAAMVAEKRRLWGDAHVTDVVNRGMKGERNCFYAFEAGHIVGAPFDAEFGFDYFAKLGAAVEGAAYMTMREPKPGQTGGQG